MKYLKANPKLVLREESDDWAVLFDPDTGHTYALNPVAVLIWKHLTGTNSEQDIWQLINEEVDALPAEAQKQIKTFLTCVHTLGLADYVESEPS
ncbi:MAG TPA: PqqD family peptide modification chaperone [Syntrophales bacterium]|nr:PqqD family peptide modification chaperone [Syntrophales bacterium]HOL58470.1 PqqD family peptide modification chaperone [Syntrophales bacterium]HPO34922.1 PqqD family peptide modification chaperone [Syntrophales bacterium]